MPHTAVPAAELAARLENLRRAISAAHPDWGMILLDSKIDLYYFTGTMQEGALVITPDEAALFVRHSYECAVLQLCRHPSAWQLPRHCIRLSSYP